MLSVLGSQHSDHRVDLAADLAVRIPRQRYAARFTRHFARVHHGDIGQRSAETVAVAVGVTLAERHLKQPIRDTCGTAENLQNTTSW